MSPPSLPSEPRPLRFAVTEGRRLPATRLVDVARARAEGPLVPPERGIPWLAEELVERIDDRWDAVCVWTGEERVSKSTGMLRLVQELMRRGARWEWTNLTYSARDLLDAYDRAKVRDAVAFDEGTRGLLAGDTFKPQQVVLTQLLANAGARGVILLLGLPDIWLLAKKVRSRRAVFWVHVDSRGTPSHPAPSHALVHERERRIRYQQDDSLGLSRSIRCPELTYEPFADDDPFWRRYLDVKNRKLKELFDELRATLDREDERVRLRRTHGARD